MSRIPLVRHRWSLLFLGLLLSAAGFLSTSAHAAERTLRWKFKAGDSLGCVSEQRVMKNIKAFGQDTAMTFTQVVDVRWDIKDVDSDGVASVTRTIERIRMKIESAQVPPMDFDSASDKDPKGPVADSMVPMLRTLVKQPMSYKMSSTGVVSDVQLPAEMIENFKKTPGAEAMGALFSADGMKQMISQDSLTLPVEAIDVGKTWQNEVTADQGKLGKVKTTTTFKYAGLTMHDGKEMDKIDTSVKLEYIEGDKSETKINIDEQESSGAIYFDNAIGRVSDASAKNKMKTTATIQGAKIESTDEITMSMKYGPAAANK